MRDDLRRSVFWVVLALDVAAALLASVFAIVVYLSPWAMSQVGDPGLREQLGRLGRVYASEVDQGLAWPLVAVSAGVLLVGNLLWLIYGGAPATPPEHVVSESPQGPVRVACEAIETALRQRGEQVEGVARLQVSIEPSAGPRRVRMRVFFHCIDEADIGLVGGEIRSALELRFGELVLLPDGHRLDLGLEFHGFAGRRPARGGIERGVADFDTAPTSGALGEGMENPPDDVFTGPRYPVDDDARNA